MEKFVDILEFIAIANDRMCNMRIINVQDFFYTQFNSKSIILAIGLMAAMEMNKDEDGTKRQKNTN